MMPSRTNLQRLVMLVCAWIAIGVLPMAHAAAPAKARRGASISSSDAPHRLFSATPVAVPARAQGRAAVRGSMDSRGLALGARRLRLHLPNRLEADLEMSDLERRGPEDVGWQGRVAGHADSRATLTLKHGLIFGRLQLEDRVFEIFSRGDGTLTVEEMNLHAFPECAAGPDQIVHADDGLRALPILKGGGGSGPPGGGDGRVVIDLLVVYSNDALVSAGSVAQMEAIIQAAVDVSNVVFQDSNVGATYHLVHSAHVDHDTLGTTGADLEWVTADAEVASMRNEYGADLVMLIVDTPGSCGTAWVQRDPGPAFAGWAYAATDVDCAVGNLTFAHESGHNLGLEHNPEDSSVGSNPSAASYPWSFAHYVDGSFRTVMSYSSPCINGCSRLALFSNPDVTHDGVPTGIDEIRDNARSANLTAPIAADFRDTVASPPGGIAGVVDRRINSGSDDVEEAQSDGVIYFDSSDLELGDDPGYNGDQTIGLRFTDLGMPQGATVTSAYLEFVVDEISSVTTDVTISAEDTDNAPGFANSPYDVTNRATTAALVPWSIPAWNTVGAVVQSPDLTGVLQEVVDRPGWSANNSLVFVIAGAGQRTAEAFEGVAAAAPLLHVEYDTPAPAPNPMTWETAPHLDPAWPNDNVGSMVAVAASDPDGGVEYYFDCVEAPAGDSWNGCADSGWQGSASFSDFNLVEGFTYNYRVKARDALGNETEWSAQAAISVFGAGNATLFAAIGDYGSDSMDESNVATLVASWFPNFVITVGDNRYGSLTMGSTVGKHYCAFLADAASGAYCAGGNAAINAFFPSLGNHDYSDGGGLGEYLDYFTLPGAGVETTGTSGTERYYDFVRGPVQFFVLDSDRAQYDPAEMAAQKAWLQGQLAGSSTPWQIVYLHHAPYSSGEHGSNPSMQWPFASWGADAVIAGHDHTYERLAIDGIPYFVNGLGGRSVYTFGAAVAGSQFRYAGDYGAMRITATDTEMTFEFINTSQTVVDRHTVQMSATNQAPTADFSFNTSDLTASFIDASTDVDGRVVAWSWDFGDGGSSTAQHPSHAYAAAGTYTVTVAVTDDDGATDSMNRPVTVVDSGPLPPAAPSDLAAIERSTGNGSKKVVTGVLLTWSDNSGNEDSFVVQSCVLETSGQGRWKTETCDYSPDPLITLGADTTSVELSGDFSGQRFRVKAVNGAGSSAWSNEAGI